MPHWLTRTAVFFFAAALSAPLLAADAGTHVELKAVPEYVSRLFVPVVAGQANTFRVETEPIDAIVEAPANFTVALDNGGVVVNGPEDEASGYARVRSGSRELTLTLVNLIPSSEVHRGVLDGYRIGQYAAPLKGMPSYEAPKGFVRLTDDNAALMVSDHYRLSDFQCKLDGDSKFLILRTEALMKLEMLQHELAQRGVNFARFTIMSGFRTPYYNSRIGNETGHSRHLYGDAMDIYIDENHDGVMDDLTGDGRADAADARAILRIAEELDQSPEWGWLQGGAGVYHANAAHGPYLHVDARGYVARWGAVAGDGVLMAR
ncbi:MAG TPA: D-Ala-D-Ala carboxypeptidase family metallohydrolase [Thermoanaerobaculia bacterium]|nr:D-Ala-D-Ala carboxypeptidase family metallohydrolase [Thermoanaerobaculia bacterium]